LGHVSQISSLLRGRRAGGRGVWLAIHPAGIRSRRHRSTGHGLAMRAAYRVRLVANLVNGSTLAGLLVAAAGRARLGPGRDGLLIGERYRLPVPPAPAFTLGNVIMTRVERDALLGHEALLAHEARHATQFACCAGLVMLPLYFTAAGVSWVLTGDFGSRNIFERRAGLADGGYADRPLRPALARWVATARPGRRSRA
jgi:hypothetical protein